MQGAKKKTSHEKTDTPKHKGLERPPTESAARENVTYPVQHRTKKADKTVSLP
jgi:hypothetical protein